MLRAGRVAERVQPAPRGSQGTACEGPQHPPAPYVTAYATHHRQGEGGKEAMVDARLSLN